MNERRSDRDKDARLAAECLAGSGDGWDRFYKAYDGLIRVKVKRSIAATSDEDHEDLVQQVYLKLANSLRAFDRNRGSLRTFVATVAERTCVDRLRSRAALCRQGGHEPVNLHDNDAGHSVIPRSDSDPPDIEFERAQLSAFIRSALGSLTGRCRKLLHLRFFRELRYGEIAEEVGELENTVTIQVRRCLARLRAEYDRLERQGLEA